MDEFARAATLEDLKNLLRSLERHQVDYLLIGGYALAAHGYQRATTDIDVLVKGTVEAGQRMKSALMVLPDQVAKDIEPEWFSEGENIRVADAFIVDIMLNANGQTYDTLKQYAQTVDLDGIQVKTVSLEGLLLTKRTTLTPPKTPPAPHPAPAYPPLPPTLPTPFAAPRRGRHG